jgi:hypothetical protein
VLAPRCGRPGHPRARAPPVRPPTSRQPARAGRVALLALAAPAGLRAQINTPRPLYEAAVPAQTVPVPGVRRTRAAGRPARRRRPAAVAGRPLTLVDVLDAALRANPVTRGALASAQAARAQ